MNANLQKFGIAILALGISGCASYDTMRETAATLSCPELKARCNAVAGTDPRKQYIPDPGPTVTGYQVNSYGNLHTSTGYYSGYATVTPYTRQSIQSQYNSGVAIGNAIRRTNQRTAIQVCNDEWSARCSGR